MREAVKLAVTLVKTHGIKISNKKVTGKSELGLHACSTDLANAFKQLFGSLFIYLYFITY